MTASADADRASRPAPGRRGEATGSADRSQAEPAAPASGRRRHGNGSRRPTPRSPGEALRELRSRLPVSPLPWRWHQRLPKLLLAGLLLAAGGGAGASVLLQDDESSSPRAALAADVPPKVRKMVNGMTLPQKVDAVIVAGLDDPDRTVAELRRRQLGGIFITEQSWPGAGTAKRLTSRLRRAGGAGGRVAPLIVARQEGGPHRSYFDLPPVEGQFEAGVVASPRLTRRWAQQASKSLRKQGFDLNLAPLADVATLDTPISDRAFGDDPALVARMTAAAVRGCKKSGLACAVGHFPGQGAASQDPASGPATVGMDPEALRSRDLVPFRAAMRERAPAVLLSLAFYSGYDPVTPGALSPTIAQELLRDRLGFRGVAITDDLSSGAIRATVGAPAAAQSALAAGADLVLISSPREARRARLALLEAARSGGIPADRLDQAVARVLQLKRRLGRL